MIERPSIADSIHVTPGLHWIDGGRHHVSLPDNLAIGPCRVDLEEHNNVRDEFWNLFLQRMMQVLDSEQDSERLLRDHQKSMDRDVYSSDQLLAQLAEFPDSAHIILWTTPTWKDRLLLWWTADALGRSPQIDPERIWLAESAVRDSDDPSILYPFGAHNREQLHQAFEQASPITARFLEDSSALWQAYAGDNPRAFDELSRQRVSSFPNLFAESVPYRFGFPRLMEDGVIHLSEWDQYLLGFLPSDEWVRPIDILTQDNPMAHPLRSMYRDGFVSERLSDWKEHQPEQPLVLSEPREGVNTITRIAYQLTERGHQFLTGGLKQLTEAPPMDIGGSQAYRDPWVVQWEAEDWEIIHV